MQSLEELDSSLLKMGLNLQKNCVGLQVILMPLILIGPI